MTRARILPVTWFFALLTAVVAGQFLPPAVQRSFAELVREVRRQEGGQAQQVQIRWFSPAATTAPGAAQSAPSLQVLDRVRGAGPMPRDRNPELAADRIVVISVDALGREVDWRIVADPRIIRAEFPDEQGRLSGRTLQYSEASLLIAIPDDPAIVSLRVYEPRLAAGEFLLQFIASVTLPQ